MISKSIKRIMMVGTALGQKGGISVVVQNYFDAGIMGRLGIDYYSTHRDGSAWLKIIYYIRALLRIGYHIQEYQLVHLHLASRWSFRRLFIILILAKIYRKKIVIHLHGALFDLYYNMASFIEAKLIRYGFSHADRVIVLSDEWLTKVTPFCELSKIVVIPNSVPNNIKKKDFEKKKLIQPKTLLFMGEFGQRKGVIDIIKAVKLLENEAPPIRVVLCGNGAVKEVKKYVTKLGLERFFFVPGWVTGEEKEKLLDEAYIYILPTYAEGLPMSILEAMVKGIPIISTPVGGIPNAIQDGIEGFLIEPGDTVALAGAIKKLLYDKELWISMAKAAQKKIESKFTIKQSLSNLKGLYQELLE